MLDDVNFAGGQHKYHKQHRSYNRRYNEFSLEVSTENTWYKPMSRHRKAGQNHSIRVANTSFENLAKLKKLGTTAKNQNLFYGKINSRLN
jgi:hypothetical protein